MTRAEHNFRLWQFHRTDTRGHYRITFCDFGRHFTLGIGKNNFLKKLLTFWAPSIVLFITFNMLLPHILTSQSWEAIFKENAPNREIQSGFLFVLPHCKNVVLGGCVLLALELKKPFRKCITKIYIILSSPPPKKVIDVSGKRVFSLLLPSFTY